jgi:PAS domain S-box-containing protein
VLSDSVLAAFVSDAETLNTFQTYKGWFYVLITTLMLYGLVSASERSIRATEERLNLALHGTNTGLREWDPKTDETYFSPTWFTMLGYEPDEFPHNYDTWARLLHPEDRPNAEKIVHEFLRTRDSSFSTEFRMRGRDGQYRWIYDQGVAARWDENGDITRMVGTHTDITERKRAEETLRRSEAKYRTLIEWANDGCLTMTGAQFMDCNQKALEILDRSREEIVGNTPDVISPPTQPDGMRSEEKALRILEKAYAGEPQVFEWVHTKGDGTPIDVEVSLTRIDVEDEPILMSLWRDITERKQAEAALRRYADHLRILHEIDQGILTARSPEAIAQAAMSHIRQLIPCQRAGIGLFDFSTNEMVLLAVDADTETKVEKSGMRMRLDRFEDEIDILRQGRVVIMFEEFQPREEVSEVLYTEEVRSVVTIPLISQDELIGILNLTVTNPSLFTEESETIARQVADQLAIAIQQARLHEQVQRHAEELEQRVADRTRELLTMYEVMAIASEALDLETTLVRSLGRVLVAMESNAGAIHLLDEGGETRRLAVQQGFPPDLVAQLESLPSRKGLGGWVIEHGQPLIVPDITSDPRMIVTPDTIPRTYVGVPMRAGGRTLGVISVLRETTQPQFSQEEITLLASLADRVGAVVERTRLRQLAEQAAVLEERQRLARELHDSVTQSLYILNLLTEAGRRTATAGDLTGVEGYLGRLGEIAQQALKEMRLLVYELRPLVLEREGLVGALQQRLDAVEGRAGVEARLLVETEVELAPPVEEALYRIAQEALNNALKHAQATSVTVRMHTEGERVELEIADNGQGFDPNAIGDTGGLGLITMRERAEQLGGTLRILSAPGEGTKVRARVGTRGNS